MARPTHQRFRFVARPEDEGKRLDQVLAANVPGLSRRQARVLLDIGGVFVNGVRVKVAGRAVRRGQAIVANVGGALRRADKEVGAAARARDEATLPQHRVVYQDDDIVVVDKPPGLVTAPTPESDRGNLAGVLQRALGGEIFVVHRLDLDTSGLLVFARTADANRALSATFRDHAVERVYLAVLRGAVPFDERTVDEPVDGRRAVTHMTALERIPAGATLVRCRLETGRTHQIRIHARHLGHPVLGDARYGEPSPLDPPRIALHATHLGLAHPRTGAPLTFDSPLPDDLSAWLDDLRDPPASAPEDLVRLDQDHPGFRDPAYRARRNAIAALALRRREGDPIPDVTYTDVERDVWAHVLEKLAPLHAQYACPEYLAAWPRVGFGPASIPQLAEVSRALAGATGFTMIPVAGLVGPRTFMSHLGRRVFLATQYMRHHSMPLYTPEPDVVHELVGHAPLLADPVFAEINRLFGDATDRAGDDAIDALIRVYWYALEFGVVKDAGRLRVVGAGLLSSFGELGRFEAHAELRPFRIDDVAATPFDPTSYQGVLFVAESTEALLAELRGFLESFLRS